MADAARHRRLIVWSLLLSKRQIIYSMTSRITAILARVSTIWLCCLFLLCTNTYSQLSQRPLPGSKAQSPSPARENCNKTPSRTICVDYSRDGGRFPAAWQYVSNLSPSNGPISDRLVKKLGIKYSRMFYAALIWSCGEGCCNFTAPEGYKTGWGDDLQIEAIIAQGALPILNIGGAHHPSVFRDDGLTGRN